MISLSETTIDPLFGWSQVSRKGNCYDNAPVESFLGTFKTELIFHQQYVTQAEARLGIFEYIEVF